MKRGQTGIGLVILGVVSIIAVIGLVLLFTRASSGSSNAQGAALTEFQSSTDLSIGNSYQGTGERGISQTYQTATTAAAPDIYYPAPVGMTAPTQQINTKGTRTPAFIVSGQYSSGGFASIEDIYACDDDLQVAGIPAAKDQFNCYTVPNKGTTTGEVAGHYPPDSAAYGRPPLDQRGKLGGDVYCYANSLGAEQQVPNSEDLRRENILRTLVDSKAGTAGNTKFNWIAVDVNGVRTPVCWVSAQTFPFPQ